MEKSNILIVDDSPENLNILKGLLGSDYNLKQLQMKKSHLKLQICFLSQT